MEACPAESEVLGQLPGCLEAAETKQLGGKVNDIAGGTAAEAVIIGVIQLHAGGMILVERAASHPSSSDRQAVQGCGLLDSDGFLYDLKRFIYTSLIWHLMGRDTVLCRG